MEPDRKSVVDPGTFMPKINLDEMLRDAERTRETMDRLASHKSEGKPLVNDLDPLFILEMGSVMTQGLTKYPNDPDGTPNWWKGGDYRSFCASILRHALKLAAGEDTDEESGLPHAAHIAVDAMFLRSWQRRGVGKDTRLTGYDNRVTGGTQHE